MSEPWEDYGATATTTESGPWDDFQQTQSFKDLSAGQPVRFNPDAGRITPPGMTTAGGPRAPLASYAETAESLQEADTPLARFIAPRPTLTEPRVTLPKPSIPPEAGFLKAAGLEAVGALEGLPEFFTSDAGVLSMLGAKLAPRLVSAGFSADLTLSAFNQAKQAYENWGKMTPAEKGKATVDVIASTILGGLTGAHAAGVKLPSLKRPEEPGFIGPIATGESLPMPRGSPAWRRPAFQLPDVPKFEETKPVEPESPIERVGLQGNIPVQKLQSAFQKFVSMQEMTPEEEALVNRAAREQPELYNRLEELYPVEVPGVEPIPEGKVTTLGPSKQQLARREEVFRKLAQAISERESGKTPEKEPWQMTKAEYSKARDDARSKIVELKDAIDAETEKGNDTSTLSTQIEDLKEKYFRQKAEGNDAQHFREVLGAIAEGKITSHPDYPSLSPKLPEAPPVVTQGAPPTRDWGLFNENLYDELDSWNPARSSGRISYELNDVADRFVKYAKADKSGKPLDELVADFAEGDEASKGQINKLRESVKAILDRERKEAPPTAPTEAPPPVVEARPPEPAISEAATVGKEKEGVVELRPGARGPWLGRSIDDSFSEAQKGYPKAKEALKGWGDDDLAQERAEMIKASLNPMFGGNAKKVLKLIDDEIEARKAAKPLDEANTKSHIVGEPFDFGAAGREAEQNYNDALTASKDADAVEMRSPKYPNMRVVITRDQSGGGKWRATRIDDKGPSGHSVYNSKEEAISDYTGGHKTAGPSWGWDFKVTESRKSTRTTIPPPPIYKSIEGAKVEPTPPEAEGKGRPDAQTIKPTDTIRFRGKDLKVTATIGKHMVQFSDGTKVGRGTLNKEGFEFVTPAQPPPPAAAKVQTEVAKVAATEGQRSAKEVKAEYVQRVEDEIEKIVSKQGWTVTQNAEYPQRWELKAKDGNSVNVDIEKQDKGFSGTAFGLPGGKRTIKGKTIKEVLYDAKAHASSESGSVTINIPGDGDVTVFRNGSALVELRDRAARISTSSGGGKAAVVPTGGEPSLADQTEKIIKAYGSAEDAYRSAKRQRDALQAQEPPASSSDREEWNKQISEAEAFMDQLYYQTKASGLETKAEEARSQASTYKMGAGGFQKEIARIKGLKRQTPRHKAALEDLERRYAQNQERIGLFEKDAERFEKEAAEEKAKLEAEPTPAPPAATGEGMPLKQSIGGAVPAEFEGNESFVSNMFAAIDRDRTELGLPPMEETIPRTWKAARAKAETMLKTDPFWISELIARTNLEPRPMLDHEIVGTVLQRAKWKAELNEAWRRIGRATEDGHPELAKDDQLLAAQMLDKIQLLDKTVGRNGSASEAGRTLNAQKMALDDDLNLVSMVLKRQADTGKKVEPGSPEFEELKKLAEEYKRTSEALQADLNSKEARVSELNAKLALEAIEKEQLRKQIPDLSPKVLEVARKWVEKWDKEATQAMNNLLGKSWSPTPEMLLDLAKVARGNMAHLGLSFAEWSVKMTEKLGKGVEQFLQGAWDRALKMIDEEAGVTEPVKRAIKKNASDAEKQADLTERLKAKLKDKRLDEITPLVQKLARTFSDQGVRGWRGIGDAVHGVLKELIPGLDYRDTLDAISGHGKFRLPDQAEGAKALRDAKSQMQEVRKIQEVIARQPVKPTGLKRDFPSDIKRRLTQIYENAKRKFGIVITDPATQLRSALQARKTYYEHRISDLEAEIKSRKRIVKTKAPSPTDPALEKLIAEYKQVKAAHDEVFGPRELTDAERAAREEKSLDRQIAEVERQIKEGDIFPRTPGERPTSPAIEAKRANLLALKSEREYLRESIQPTQYLTAEEKQLKAIKAGLARNIADKTARMARGDFTPKAKRPPPTLDAETLRLRAENQRVVKEYRRMAMKDELAKATPMQRAIAMALRLRRFEVLSGIHSIYKLASYSLQKLAGTPPEEALGAGLMKLPGLRTVGEKSTEVGYNTAKEIEYIKKGFTQGIRDAQQVWKRGESDLGAVYDPRIQKDVEWTGFFGRLHLMEKSVLLRTAFERAKDRLIEKAAAEGQPVSDEAVQLRIGIEAYNYAMQEILMNPNVLSKRVNRFLNSLEEKQKDTGRPRSSLTTLKTALELKLPIRNVPVNYIARTMDYVVGTEMGLSKLGMAFSRGIETLTPAEANAIKRHLTRGLIGKAVMALGFFNPNIFGGYYEPGEKRRKDEPKALTMQVYGHNIPTFLLHNPLLEAAQFGATIRRIADSKIRKRDQNTQGIGAGMVGAVIGLLDETPYIRGMADYGKLRDPRQRGQTVANEVRSLLIPQLLQNIAQDFDKDAQGERIIRRPQTFMQGIQVGIPGLRQQVPVSPTANRGASGTIPSFVPTVQQR